MSIAEPHRSPIISRLLGIAAILLAHLVALLFVMIALCKAVPAYVEFFGQEDVALPAATQQIFRFSYFCIVYFFPVVFLVMATDAAVVFTLSFAFHRKRWLLSAYSHLCLLAASAVLVYVTAWLSHPVLWLIRQE